jgi:kynurenine formamidase
VRIARIVELSIVLDGGTPTYPGDPKPAIRQATTIEANGHDVLSLAIGSHTGLSLEEGLQRAVEVLSPVRCPGTP